MNFANRVMLRGVLERTHSCVAIDDHGDLVVELYDHSDAAHTWLGNDVAFLLHVSAADKDRALARLVPDAQPASAPDRDALLLRLLKERFADYYAVQQWLNDEGIPFRKEFEPWA